MDFFSFIFGADSFRKLVLTAGLILIALGVVIPYQKVIELQEKQIRLEESKTVDLLQIQYFEKQASNIDKSIKRNTKKVSKLKHNIDSVSKSTIAINDKTLLINSFNTEINSLNKTDQASLDAFQLKKFELQKFHEKVKTEEKEIKNLKGDIFSNKAIQWICIILGFCLLITGVYFSYMGQKESDKLLQTEIKIKQEELIKIQKQNAAVA